MLEINKKKLVPGIVATWGDITGNVENQEDLVEYIDNHTPEVVWGGITGDITAQEDLREELSGKQDTLVSGVNIKTVNDQSLLGPGNITIECGGEDNVIEVVKVNGTALTPDVNKAVDVIVPTKTSDLTNDSGYLTENNLKTINGESIVGSGDIEVGGLTPEQEDAIDVIINAGDGFLKHTPAVSVIGAREAITTVEGRQQNLYTLNGDVYLLNTFNFLLYKFNRQTYQFEEGPQATGGSATPYQHLWADSQGRVYSNNEYIVNLETGEYTYKDMGGDFQIHTGSNYTNIIERDGVVYMISYNNSCAYIFNESTQEFDSSIPVQGTFPANNFYRYFTEFEGHWIYDAGSTQTELVFHLDVAEPYAEWVTLSERLFPGAWTYEYEGQTINETTRGVYVHPVIINNVREYYTWGYRNPVMYKLVNGAWEIVPFTMNVTGYNSNSSGVSIDDLWLGYGYISGTNVIIMWNFGEAKGTPDSYDWGQIDLTPYATQTWVGEQNFAYNYQLGEYVYDPDHHLNLTGSVPLVDDKEIANTDQCILNRSYSYPGPRFESVAGFSGMNEGYLFYFVTPSGRLIYSDPINRVAYEFDGTQWTQLQTVTTFVAGEWRAEINDGLYVINNNDSSLYRWDDTNSDWVFIINMPEQNIWAADANTLRCGIGYKLVNNGGTYEWDSSDPTLSYDNQKSLKVGQTYYYVHYNYVYTYDESVKNFTQIGIVQYADGNHWFTYNGCLYYFWNSIVRKVDPSQFGTEQWDTITDIYYSSWDFAYVVYDSKIWTVKYNDSLGYNQLGYTYDIIASVPAVPASDGTYVLKATVLNGQVTYSWVVDEVAQAVQITNEILG